MQINVDMRDLIGAELGQLSGNATPNKQQSQFSQLLGKHPRGVVGSTAGDTTQLSAEPESKSAIVDSTTDEKPGVMSGQFYSVFSDANNLHLSPQPVPNNALDPAAAKPAPSGEIMSAVAAGVLGLVVGEAKVEMPSNEMQAFPKNKAGTIKVGEQNLRLATSSLQQLAGQQHYAAVVVNQGQQSSQKLAVYSPWRLIATGYLSYEVQENAAQTVASRSSNNEQLATATVHRVGQSAEPLFNISAPSKFTFSADWAATAEPFQQIDNVEEQNQILSTQVLEEWLSPLMAEHLMVLPDTDNKERLYYRNFNARDPEQALKQALQLWQPVNLQQMDLYINGRFSEQGAAYAG